MGGKSTESLYKILCLIFGLISCALAPFGAAAMIGLLCGIVGLFLSGESGHRGNALRTAGTVFCLLGTVLCTVLLLLSIYRV